MTDVTRESLAAALRTAAFAMPAKRMEDYDPDDFYQDYADAILAALPRAAQPAPDLDVPTLAEAMRRTVNRFIANPHTGEIAQSIAAEYTRLLQARESGGE